jgi:hypothetical protein
LRDDCEKLFTKTGISKRQDYHENYGVLCPVYSVKKHLKFNHGLGNGTPESLFEQANLRSQQSVTSSALMLHAITNSATVSRNRCAALAREADITSEAAEEAVELLKAVCPIIFVDRKNADEEILSVALNGDHRVSAKRSKRT